MLSLAIIGITIIIELILFAIYLSNEEAKYEKLLKIYGGRHHMR